MSIGGSTSRFPGIRQVAESVEPVFERIGRVDLATTTDMTPASETRLVARSKELGLLSENAHKDGARGQPKRLLGIQRQKFCPAGFYRFTLRTRAAPIDIGGTVVASTSKPMERVLPEKS